ncbi:ricin-type beta-trefoil lectin domain protein [Streptomyces sp. NPDC001389]|uniref:ricin-type beta-trefoil lectin domain protein n=1 Tax=unclassified Streptomyces TaxID=2593676 RepID=UPI003687673D
MPVAERAEQSAPGVESASLPATVARQPDAGTAATAIAERGETEPETATAVDGEEVEEAEGAPEGMAEAEPAAPPGRPHKSLLAGAAIVGALLMTVPFLVGGDGKDPHAAPAGAVPGTVLGSPGDGSLPGAVGSASPTPGGTAVTGGPAGESPASPGAADSGAHADSGGASVLSGGGGTPAGPVERQGEDSSAQQKTAAAAPPPAPRKASPTANAAPEGLAQAAGVSVRSHASGRCIDVTGGQGDGTPLQIWDCNGLSQQSWRFMNDGTVRALGMCMDVAWGATGNGAVIQLARCNGNPAQQFRLNSAHDLVNPRANKCVDVKDLQTGNGTRLQLWDCNGWDNQKWSRS